MCDVLTEDARVDLEVEADFVGNREPLDVHSRLPIERIVFDSSTSGRVVMKALRINLSVLMAFLTIGFCYGEAWGLFDKARATIYYTQGSQYLERGQHDQAITSFTNAIELNPEYAEAYNNRGVAHLDKNQYDQAISDCTKAIEINPKYAMAYNNRGLAYVGKGLYDKAISDCTKAIELNPKHAMAYNNRALACYSKGEYDKAWEDVHKAQSLGLQIHPGFLNALREASGILEEQMGGTTSVKKTLEKNIDPQEACQEDCREMFEKGELKKGMTVEECIKFLCK